ncbi:hypothetical protein EHI8A_088240 [Entamoeba histolytica HM-1:IMSS-B]|uniref:Alpha-type protein kinase domain-containing protein n=6 Tax=Entamoeba histolytica TaxID=5759 RepID=C4M5E6_ENTH1|nr:hypothetical protein EHI_132020 [Entamoeba histolytica HM-1:IMSS]EMD46854.1 Hypothetical protein EHI5A_124010 [Entamoeba histolytica KU27]EMH75892.1 hypothetical protein EHI8A_088240 [Entamoeba histolytica HM-1:IMSS-B]EMS11315.1 hypothetical protein KM1_159570 [Entamoeba histolytica HM-3:IMSS]ENY61900.1 hypothetical protein EHI7A_082110 [Entamoeba histolytica HM-1:IMSS-A]GAT96651.1 hypothetical protein CL6EHI_132020 [Entamoeba histolytica]|eukprot:XP_652603.1 hypothetical protein EHI_132020 [Entamoeba histolytica HM-1:IMSS]
MSFHTIETLETAYCSNEQLINSLERIEVNVNIFKNSPNTTELPLIKKLIGSVEPTIIVIIDTLFPIEYQKKIIQRIQCIIRICQHSIEQFMIISYNNNKIEVELFSKDEINQLKTKIHKLFNENILSLNTSKAFVNRALSSCVPIENNGGDIFVIHFGYRMGVESLEEKNCVPHDLEYERTFDKIALLGYDYWLYFTNKCPELKQLIVKRSHGHITENKCIEMTEDYMINEISENLIKNIHQISGITLVIDNDYLNYDTLFSAFGCCETMNVEHHEITITNESSYNQGNWEINSGIIDNLIPIELVQFREMKGRITDFYVQRTEVEAITKRIINEVSGILKNQMFSVDFGKIFIGSDEIQSGSISLTQLKSLSKGIPKWFIRKKYENEEIEMFGLLKHNVFKQNTYLDSFFTFVTHYSFFRTAKRLVLFDFVVKTIENKTFIINDCHIVHESLRFNQILSNGLKYKEVINSLKGHSCTDLCRLAHLPIL